MAFRHNRNRVTQEATASSESLFRELRFSRFLSEEFAFCSALESLSTKRRVSLADNSPSLPHLRLDRSGGLIGRVKSWKCKLRAPELLLCRCPGKIYGRNTEGLFVAIHNLYFSAQSKALIICFLNSTVDSYASCKFFAALGFFLIK